MKSCPIWEKECSRFPWRYEQKETCLIVKGAAEVHADGQTVSIGPGDYVVFPKGLECTWVIQEPLRKHYRFE